jgi:hypothetical protein
MVLIWNVQACVLILSLAKSGAGWTACATVVAKSSMVLTRM